MNFPSSPSYCLPCLSFCFLATFLSSKALLSACSYKSFCRYDWRLQLFLMILLVMLSATLFSLSKLLSNLLSNLSSDTVMVSTTFGLGSAALCFLGEGPAGLGMAAWRWWRLGGGRSALAERRPAGAGSGRRGGHGWWQGEGNLNKH